jgi:hypothetical protein
MTASSRVRVATAVFILAAGAASQALAGPSYSCKGDKRLDAPMQFTATVLGNQVHVVASGGADKSNWVVPSVWRLYASGKLVDYFPKSTLVFVSESMLAKAHLDGLAAGAYDIELTSTDFCNNKGIFRTTVTVTTPQPENDPPTLSTPSLALLGLQTGQFSQIQFSLTDNTGIQRVAVFINGTKLKEFTYYDGVNIRWWCDDYPTDATVSVLEGPNYYVTYPTSYKGQYSLVEIDAVDVVGNVSRTSAWLVL